MPASARVGARPIDEICVGSACVEVGPGGVEVCAFGACVGAGPGGAQFCSGTTGFRVEPDLEGPLIYYPNPFDPLQESNYIGWSSNCPK